MPALTSNVAFGDRFRSRLFICAGDSLYAIFLNVRGADLARWRCAMRQL